MLKPGPRVGTDFHGSFFGGGRKATGEIAGAGRSSAAGPGRFRWPAGRADAAPRGPTPNFLQLSVPATLHGRPVVRQNTARLLSRDTIRAAELLSPPRVPMDPTR